MITPPTSEVNAELINCSTLFHFSRSVNHLTNDLLAYSLLMKGWNRDLSKILNIVGMEETFEEFRDFAPVGDVEKVLHIYQKARDKLDRLRPFEDSLVSW